MSFRSVFIAASALGLAGGIVICEHVQTSRLRSEIKAMREASRISPLLEVERDRLAALQVSPEELEQLRRDHREISQMRASLARLGNKVLADELFRRAIATTRSSSSPVKRTADLDGAEYFDHYAGNETPEAVLDSVIWAAKAGNVETLARLIAFDSTGRAKALELFHGLPPDVQKDYGRPENVYATLVAANIPLGLTQATVIHEENDGIERVTLAMRLQRHNDAWHNAQFAFQRSGGTWQLVIPDGMVEKFGAAINGKTGVAKK